MANKDGQKKPDHFIGPKTFEPGDPTDGTYNLVLSCHDCLAKLGLPPDATGLTQAQLDEVQFVFTWDAQLYFQERGLTDPPKYCKHHYRQTKQTARRNNVNGNHTSQRSAHQ